MDERNSLTVSLRLSGRAVVLVGEGPAADEQRRMLKRAGALVVGEGSKAAIAVVVGDPAAVSRLKVRGTLVYAVGQPELCDFTPAEAVSVTPTKAAKRGWLARMSRAARTEETATVSQGLTAEDGVETASEETNGANLAPPPTVGVGRDIETATAGAECASAEEPTASALEAEADVELMHLEMPADNREEVAADEANAADLESSLVAEGDTVAEAIEPEAEDAGPEEVVTPSPEMAVEEESQPDPGEPEPSLTAAAEVATESVIAETESSSHGEPVESSLETTATEAEPERPKAAPDSNAKESEPEIAPVQAPVDLFADAPVHAAAGFATRVGRTTGTVLRRVWRALILCLRVLFGPFVTVAEILMDAIRTRTSRAFERPISIDLTLADGRPEGEGAGNQPASEASGNELPGQSA